MSTLEDLRNELKLKSNPEKAKVLQRFFKTGKGQYGEGDVFLGIILPESRKLANKFGNLISLKDAEELLRSSIHEERLVSLLILIHKYKKGDDKTQEEIYSFYIKNAKRVNNWDLVDLSARDIVGAFLHNKDKSILENMARSDNIWERRIAIISTFYFIKQKQFDSTLKIAEILLHDKHDLIQKAVGWMIREVGNRNIEVEEKFLKKHYKSMPRTMLRYAIEKFPEEKRKAYLRGEI